MFSMMGGVQQITQLLGSLPDPHARVLNGRSPQADDGDMNASACGFCPACHTFIYVESFERGQATCPVCQADVNSLDGPAPG